MRASSETKFGRPKRGKGYRHYRPRRDRLRRKTCARRRVRRKDPGCGDSRGCVGAVAAQRAGPIDDPANGSHQTMALQGGPDHVAVRRVSGEIDRFGRSNSGRAANRNLNRALGQIVPPRCGERCKMGSAIHRRQKCEVRVCCLKGGAVMPGAGCDHQVGSRHRNASRPRPLSQIVGLSLNRFVYRELRKCARKLPENLLFPPPAGAVPQFELHQRTPACLSAGQGCFDATPHCRVAVRTKHVYPARRVDQDHGSASATLGLEFFGCNQVVACAGVLDQFGHAHATIEVGDGADHGLTLGLRVREPDSILKFAIWNINRSLHAHTLDEPSSADNDASISAGLAMAS